ncbi:MAG: hypothetical protein ACLFVH_05775 [Phycisphaerae bacterium]
MTRDRMAMFVLGAALGIAGAAVLWWGQVTSATAEPTAKAQVRAMVKGEYAPGFAEFVTDWVRTQYCFEHALGAVFCSSPELVNGRLRWTLSGEVNRGAGDPYRKRWLRAKRDLKRDVELWSRRGYDIRWSDFELTVDEPRPRRSDTTVE